MIQPYVPKWQPIGYQGTVTKKSYKKTCYPVPEYGDVYDATNEKLLSLLTLPDWYTNKDGRNTCKKSVKYCPYSEPKYDYNSYSKPTYGKDTYGKAACGKCDYDCKCLSAGKPYCGCKDKTYGGYGKSCGSCKYSKPTYKKSYGYGKLY